MIPFKQNDSIFVDAPHNISPISACRKQTHCLVVVSCEGRCKVKKRLRSTFFENEWSSCKRFVIHMFPFPRKQNSCRTEIQVAPFNHFGDPTKEQECAWVATQASMSKSAWGVHLDNNNTVFFYQLKALSYPLLVTKKFFSSKTPSWENQIFVF